MRIPAGDTTRSRRPGVTRSKLTRRATTASHGWRASAAFSRPESVDRILESLLACSPPEFQRRYGSDIRELFDVRLERAQGRPLARIGLWIGTAVDLSRTAFAEWTDMFFDRRARQTSYLQRSGRLSMTDRLWLDLRDAGRRLALTPGFTLAALLVLTLGIGASTTIFSAVDAFALRERPYERPWQLVHIYQDSDDGRPESNSYPTFVDVAHHTDLFESVGAVMPEGSGTLLTASGEAVVVQLEFATSTYFPVLGLMPSLGRWFLPEEDRPGAAPVAVLTHAAWQRRFMADPNVLGRTVRLSGAAVTIVGVGPASHNGFVAGLASDFWLSISALAPVGGAFRGATLTRREDHWFQIIARLRPGRSVGDAQSSMNVLAARLGRDFPETDRGRRITVMSARDVRVHPGIDALIYPTAGLHLLLTGLLLAVVCSNLANLVLARGSTRSRDVAVRLAIGATRTQIVRSMLIECLLLSLGGGLAGLALAWWGIRLIGAIEIPLRFPIRPALALDYRLALFALGIAVLCGLAFGILPALRNSRRDVAATLQRHGRTAAGAFRILDLRGILIAVQVAISIALISGGGVLLRSLLNAMRVDLGFNPLQVAVATVDPMQAGQTVQQSIVTLLELRDRAAALPGVVSAALTSRPPLSPFGPSNTLVLDDQTLHRTSSGTVDVPSAGVSSEYFETMGIPLLHGRLFTDADRSGAERVAIVSEAMGRRFWGDSNVVGRRYRHEGSATSWVTIVGVVKDVPLVSPAEPPRPFVYRPHSQGGWGRAAVVLRGSGDPADLVNALRHEVRAINPAIPVMDAAPMTEHVGRSLAVPRAATRLLIALGAMAILLAAVGIYSVVAFSVARRRPEIGVRMALGATGGQVVGMVVAEMMRLVVVGIAAGLALAAFLTPVLRSLLVGIHPLDPLTFAGATVLIAAVAAVTAWWPARRAADGNPAMVLKTE